MWTRTPRPPLDHRACLGSRTCGIVDSLAHSDGVSSGQFGSDPMPSTCALHPERSEFGSFSAPSAHESAPLPLSPAPLPVAFPPRHPYLFPIGGGGAPLNPPDTQNGLVQLGLFGGFAPHNPYFVPEN